MFIFNLARANSAIIATEEVERLKSHPGHRCHAGL
jgi:hypothetical protein